MDKNKKNRYSEIVNKYIGPILITGIIIGYIYSLYDSKGTLEKEIRACNNNNAVLVAVNRTYEFKIRELEEDVKNLNQKVLYLEKDVKKLDSKNNKLMLENANLHDRLYSIIKPSLPHSTHSIREIIPEDSKYPEKRLDVINGKGNVISSIRNVPVDGNIFRLLELYQGPIFPFAEDTLPKIEFDQYSDLVARYLFENPENMKARDFKKIVIVGYADPAGSKAYNDSLSLKRAEYIANEIIIKKYRVPVEILETIGHGERLLDYSEDNIEIIKDIAEALGMKKKIVPLDYVKIKKSLGNPEVIKAFRNLSREERELEYRKYFEKNKELLKYLRVVFIIGLLK